MKKLKAFFLTILMCFMLFQLRAFAHEGHQEEEMQASEKQVEAVNFDKIIKWVGNFHPILLHFPIALITMAAVSELFFFWGGNSFFDQASRFMVLAAAVTVIPTVLTGLAYGYNAQYEGIMATYFWWHRFSGIFTAMLAIITAVIKGLPPQKFPHLKTIYYVCLFLLFISASVTGFLGGSLTFGIGHLWPPFL